MNGNPPAKPQEVPPLRMLSPATMAMFGSILEDRPPPSAPSPGAVSPRALNGGLRKIATGPPANRSEPPRLSPFSSSNAAANRPEPRDVRHNFADRPRPQPNHAPNAIGQSYGFGQPVPLPGLGMKPISLLGLLADEDSHRPGSSSPRQRATPPIRITPPTQAKRTSADALIRTNVPPLHDNNETGKTRRTRGLATSMSKSLGDLTSLPALSQEKWQRDLVLSSTRRAQGDTTRTQLIGANRERPRQIGFGNARAMAQQSAGATGPSSTQSTATDEEDEDENAKIRSRGRSRNVEDSVPLFLANLRLQLQRSRSQNEDSDARESSSNSSADTTPHESSTDTENDFALTTSERDSGEEEADLSEWGDDGDTSAPEGADSSEVENDSADNRGRETITWKEASLRQSMRDPRKVVTITLNRDAAKRGSRREDHQILFPQDDDFQRVGWSYGQLSRSVVEEGALTRPREFLSNNRLAYKEEENDNEANDQENYEDGEPETASAQEEPISPRMEPISPRTTEASTNQEPSGKDRTKANTPRKRSTKRKKKKVVQANREPLWFYLDVLLIEATDLLPQKIALQTIYGVKNLGNPYFKISLMSDGVPWRQHCDAGGGYPYRTRSLKGAIDNPTWNDGISYVYRRLTVANLWDSIQPSDSKISQPEMQEAKERFLQRWKKLEEGPNSEAEQRFLNLWRSRCEPQLEIKLYFSTGGKKDILAGSVTVSLADLQATYLHDVWLNLHPPTKLPAPRNEAEQRFLDKWASSEVWGSVHLLIQKSKRERNGMLRAYGTTVRPFPLRMEVGDIILFDSSSLRTQGTKLATRSRWDHAALVVMERGESELQLFEATMDGVLVFNLKRRLKAYIKDTNIAVRRLQVERTDEMMEALYQFIEMVKGRPYKKNPVELLKALAKVNATDNLGSLFCSQLVAAAYQVMGLLSMDEPSNNYLPGDLASNSRVKLLKGTLGELMLIPRLKPNKKGKRTSV